MEFSSTKDLDTVLASVILEAVGSPRGGNKMLLMGRVYEKG